jgi:hypothetical protein
MTGAWMGSSPVLLEPVRKLCRIPAGCSCLLIPAFLGGYPAGAQAVGQTLHQGGLSRKDAERMLLFCNNPGPSFLFGVLGNALNMDFSHYSNDLSASLSDSTSMNKHLKIFEDMLDMMKKIFNFA